MQLGPLSFGPTQITFYYAPAQELFSLLHLLAAPQHHPAHHAFVQQAGDILHPDLLHAIRSLPAAHSLWQLPLDVVATGPLRALPVAGALEQLAALTPLQLAGAAAAYPDIATPPRTRTWQAMLRTAGMAHAALTPLLAGEPLRMEAHLAREAALCRRLGLAPYLATLHERARVEHTRLVLLKQRELHFALDKPGCIAVALSAFMAPHLQAIEAPDGLWLTRTIPPPGGEGTAASATAAAPLPPPQDLTRILHALSDETRLRILRLVDAQPMGTATLAHALGMSAANISKHLQVMATAGVLTKQRSGSQVLYFPCAGCIDLLPYRLYEYLRN